MDESQIKLHNFVDFDFNDPDLIVTHSVNGYSAAYTTPKIIVIWKNDHPGPNLTEGKVMSIVIDQFEKIDQFQWIYNTNDLLIRVEDNIIIWDIFSNQRKTTHLTTEAVLYAKQISIGLLLVKINGKFSLIMDDREITSQLTSDLIFDVPEGVLIYPNLFQVFEGEWIETELSMSLGQRLLRRRFEGTNDIQTNGDMIQIGEYEIENLKFPEALRHQLDDCGLMVITVMNNYYIARTRKYLLFVKMVSEGDEPEGILLSADYQLFRSNIAEYYIARAENREEKVVNLDGYLLKSEHKSEFKNSDILLENIPASFYIDTKQTIEFVRYNDKYGLLWYPDFERDYVFFDLFYQIGSIFTDIGRDKHNYVLIDKEATSVLLWQRGENYPSGTLTKYDIENPENEPETIYDIQISTKRIGENDFNQPPEDLEFPLILPEWHKIRLWAKTEEIHFFQDISFAQYYLLIDRLSQSEGAALLDYPQEIPEKEAFILFGTLELPVEDNIIKFQNIAPEWTFHPNTGLLAYYTIDKHCYVINTFDKFLLPIYSFESNIPYLIQFSQNGMYLIFLSFIIKETELHSHPNDGNPEHLQTIFPYMIIEIHNLVSKKSYKRSVRFPLLLDYTNIEIKEEDNRIYVFHPSYTNNAEEAVTMFDISTKKYHQVSGTEHYRMWMTHSRNSPYSRIDKGDEFPMEEHPEVSRDYSMRPFEIYQGVLVRKEDQSPITMADINLENIPQQSTANIYDLEDRVSLEVPFYYTETMKEIYISKDKLGNLKLKNFYVLDEIENHLEHEWFDLEKIPRNNNLKARMAGFVKYIVENNIVHNKYGISFENPEFEIYKEFIEKLLEEKGLS